MTDTRYTFTPDDAPELASLSKRFAGQIIDGFIPLFFLIAVVMTAHAVGTAGSVFLFVAFVFYFAYILFADALSHGQSFGKRLLGIRVVDAKTGASCTWLKSALRNFTYFLGIFDWIFIFGENRQRLGDMIARTIVIDA